MNKTNHSSYKYSFSFSFEDSFVPFDHKQWMEDYWHTSFYFSGAYVIIIFVLKYLMKDRKPYSLSGSLLVWNMGTAIFSMIVFIRMIPEWVYSADQGIYYLICSSDYLTENNISSFWGLVFILSKPLQFGDTIFTVLRKRKLLFLQWYHHAVTLIVCWYSYKDFTSSSQTFVVMNTVAHSFMYSYYALRGMKIPLPRAISAMIMLLHISEMVVGLYISCKTLEYISKDMPCDTSQTNAVLCSIVYFSYFALFVRLFYRSYISKPRFKRIYHVNV